MVNIWSNIGQKPANSESNALSTASTVFDKRALYSIWVTFPRWTEYRTANLPAKFECRLGVLAEVVAVHALVGDGRFVWQAL